MLVVPAPAGRPLDDRARDRLLRRYARHRSAADLESLVVSYAPLARSLARRYARGGAADPDLEQVACEGLVKALQRFDPDRGTPFTSFALPTILGELRRFIRDTSWCAHVPRRVQERVQAVRRATDAFTARNGRPPTAPELADAARCTVEDVVEALAASATCRTVSFDAEPADDDDGATLADRLGTDDPAFEHVEHLASIERALPGLAPEEQAVIRLRFAADLSQREIALRLGVSRSHVGRLLERSLDHLRAVAA